MQSLKTLFHVKHLIHLTMLAFAGASLGNIHQFFASAGHPTEVAWALGIALGSALVIISIMITQMDQKGDPQAFGWLIATALLLGGISGALQMHVYREHLTLQWSILLGFGIPLGGEVCLAFATSAYIKAKGRAAFRSVSVTVESAVADRLENAIAAIDDQAIQQHVEETIHQLARQAVDSVAAQAQRYYYHPGDAAPLPQIAAVPHSAVNSNGAAVTRPAPAEDTATAPKPLRPSAEEDASEGTTAPQTEAMEERKQAVLDLLTAEAEPMKVSDIADGIGVHRDTARRYLNELQENGDVENVRHRWQLCPAPTQGAA